MLFAEKLRQLREAAGLSEAKLAKASGVTFASIHGYGGSRRKPSFSAVVKIAQALGVTCEAFAACEDVVNEEEAKPIPTRVSDRPRKFTPSMPPAADREATEKKPRGGRRKGK